MKTLHGISSAGVIKVCKPCSLPSSRAESPSIVTYSSKTCEPLFYSLCLWSSLDTLLSLYSLLLSVSVVCDPMDWSPPASLSSATFLQNSSMGLLPQAWLPCLQDSPSTWTTVTRAVITPTYVHCLCQQTAVCPVTSGTPASAS